MAYIDVGLSVDGALEQQLKRASSSPQSLALSNQDDEEEMQQFLDMVRKAPPVSILDDRLSRQERLYEMARMTAGLAPVMPIIRESQSAEHLPANRSAAAHTAWNGRMTPYEPFRASPLVNSNSMSERSSAPAKVESVTSFGSSSSLLDGLLPAAVQPDNYLDNLLSEYISVDDITGGIRPMPSSIPHTFSPSPFSPVEYCTSPGLQQYADLSASLPAANSPLFTALNSLNSVSPMGMSMTAMPMSPISPLGTMAHVNPLVLSGLLAEERAIHRSKSAPTSPTLSPGMLRRQSMLSRLPMSGHGRTSNGDASGSQKCANCGASNTVLWRQCKVSGLTVCNPCGLYSAKHGVIRPKELMAPDSPIKRRVRRRKTSTMTPVSASGSGSAIATPIPEHGESALATQEVPSVTAAAAK